MASDEVMSPWDFTNKCVYFTGEEITVGVCVGVSESGISISGCDCILNIEVQLVNRLMEANRVWLVVEKEYLQTSSILFCTRKLELDLQHRKCQVMIVELPKLEYLDHLSTRVSTVLKGNEKAME